MTKEMSIAQPARLAATVAMLRDGPEGLEVFLLKRHGLSDVLGGAYVFPGGKVDSADSEIESALFLDETPLQLRERLREPDLDERSALGFYVAAVREAFEESGVLFAQSARAEMIERAHAMHRQGLDFQMILRNTGMRLSTSALVPWSRWITPRVSAVSKKRFDTRFFVSALPVGQTARHDNHETTESVWLSPKEALRQYWNKTIELAPPQIMSLSHLASHSSVQSVLSEARHGKPPTIEPEPFEDAQGRGLCYPGDPCHSDSQRALPGPTRLVHRNQRFEPLGGLQELLG